MTEIIELREREFDKRQLVRELRRTVYEHGDLNAIPRLAQAETELQTVSESRAQAESQAGYGQVVSVKPDANLLGADTTGIEVNVDLHMTSVPTALVHLFGTQDNPLIVYKIVNNNSKSKRLRLISYVEGYSARAVDTVELEQLIPVTVSQLPTFFPDRLASVTELTRATVNVEVQDLDVSTEVHKTVPVWLLARSTAPLQIQDPSTGKLLDMTKYLGAFVTPNEPAVMHYLQVATDKHPNKRLVGYQVDEGEVLSQVRAVYEALATSGIKYVNSIIDFTPERGSATQRIRLPRESIGNTSANCIDGTLLMASLLEAVSLSPAIVLVPGHAFLGWETWRNSNTWRYVETTMISTAGFDDACARGDQTAQKWLASSGGSFKRLALRDLRAQGITPLE